MWLSLIVGLLFLGGAGYTLLQPVPDVPEGLVAGAIGVTLLGLFFFERVQRGSDRRFLEWLTQNAGSIAGGGAHYNDLVITPDTELVRYQAALSFLIISVKLPSRFYVREQEEVAIAVVLFTLVTLTLGWWGIPWGPIYTIQSLATNFRGGQRHTIRDILAAARV